MLGLTKFIVVLCSLLRFGTCLASENQGDAVVKYFDSGISHGGDDYDDKQLYYETTMIPGWTDSDSSNGDDLEKSYEDEFLKPKPIISDPAFDNSSFRVNSSTIQEFVTKQNKKRDIPVRGMTHEMEMKFLQMHNIYRGQVTPSAGNMAFMEWDDELANLAQIWADECNFSHRIPNNTKYKVLGQNLYIGEDPTGYLGLQMWFNEYHYYDMRQIKCEFKKQCGHYVQMAWPESNKLGCGMTQCGMKYMFVCHYIPQALKETQMYKIGKPCSQCPEKDGSLCIKNLCMSPEQCRNNPFICQFAECDLECLNCGRLHPEKCICECADGWDSTDCSLLCKNRHDRCAKSPGWPTKAACSMNKNIVGEKFCREMCEKCNPVNLNNSNNNCCDGKLCEDGFVLDIDCKCKLLCPGPLCDNEASGLYGAVVDNSANSMAKMQILAYWLLLFVLCC